MLPASREPQFNFTGSMHESLQRWILAQPYNTNTALLVRDHGSLYSTQSIRNSQVAEHKSLRRFVCVVELP